MSSNVFDAIVVGSGITGGWAAKELTERGLKVAMIERGRLVEHQSGYTTETMAPWQLPFRGIGDPEEMKRDFPLQGTSGFINEWNQHFFANERENPYQTADGKPFVWIRGYQLGGKSLIWGRQSYRWSDHDFEANKRDGHGVDWPIRYADLAPWYDHVETFAGISGNADGLEQLPDGQFQPPMAMNHVEKAFKARIESQFPTRRVIMGRTANLTLDKENRTRCQYRNICSRGCSYGGYFSTQSSTLPAATATGNLTVITDTRVVGVDFDPKTHRATGVRTIGANGQGGSYQARVIFLCAGALNSVELLLLSRNEAAPKGLGGSSGALGKGVMDHAMGFVMASVPGYLDRDYYGFTPNGIYIPRFRNITEPSADMVRGYGIQGAASRQGWMAAAGHAGVGEAFKNAQRQRGPWTFFLGPFAECLPRDENHVSLDEAHPDPQGLPQLKIDVGWSDNERRLVKDGVAECERMLEAFGATVTLKMADPPPPGRAIHEMGGARMGRDPATSVLGRFNQVHDAPNVFVTDGAAMASTACQNPSLTYMALTARACDAAVGMMKEHVI